jgi:hypothetical protein
MSEREKAIDGLLRAAGLKPALVGIGRDDDVPWAKFRIGGDLRTLVASSAASDDESAVADIVLQAHQLGID